MNTEKTAEKIESKKIASKALPKIKALKNTRGMQVIAGGQGSYGSYGSYTANNGGNASILTNSPIG